MAIMVFENPRIHRCPEPWRSGQRQTNVMVTIISGMLISSGALFLFLYYQLGTGGVLLMFSGLLILAGIIIILVGLYTNFDGKDSWSLTLPYNRLLFDLMSERIPAMFSEKKYHAEINPGVKLTHAVRDRHTHEILAHSYSLETGTGCNPVLEYGLTVIRSNKHTYYHFQMTVSGIRMENIEFAGALVWDIQLLLETAEYRKFRQILEM